MPKKPENEDQAWAGAYCIALALLTLGRSSKFSTVEADGLDAEARAIADRAVETLKERGSDVR